MRGCGRGIARRGFSTCVLAGLLWLPSAVLAECSSDGLTGTYDLIQKAIFENRGCTSSICHGAAAAGGLDLRADVSYDNLVDVPAQTAPNTHRVLAGQKDRSLLFVNLAAKTLPDEWQAPLRAMPLDPVAPLRFEELELIRRWIEGGAPREGTVRGTADLIDACLPPPQPIEIKPLPPPAPGEGVQLHMPLWTVGGGQEHEVCFASYYDFTGQVPAAYLSDDGTSFRFNRSETRQDPLSHHLIVNRYDGDTSVESDEWGEFRCRGGVRDGELCDPQQSGACGAGSDCGSDSVNTLACIGFGPGDSGIGLGAGGIVSTQETASDNRFSPGVYAELPLKGVILWDSHAFNLNPQAGKLEAWINFYFAPLEEQRTPVQLIFNVDKVFDINAPAFGTDEVCNHHVLPADAHLYELSSHVHKRGKHFRTYLGAWRCEGGPAAGKPCDPSSRAMCGSGSCLAWQEPRTGDCNRDHGVTVDELLTSVSIALGSASMEMCEDADLDASGAISVDELITAITSALNGMPAPVPRSSDDDLLYVNFIYNDPITLRFDAPLIFPGEGSPDDDRSLTYCAFFDNGAMDPNEVKHRSTSPEPPVSVGGIGGPCVQATHCTSGKVGSVCSGRGVAARNASCDSTPGAGDGLCDACPLTGGATSEDEMFILIGQYFVP